MTKYIFMFLFSTSLMACSSKEKAQEQKSVSPSEAVTATAAEETQKKAPGNAEVSLQDRKGKVVGLVKISELASGVLVTFESKYLPEGHYELIKGAQCSSSGKAKPTALPKKIKVLGDFSSGGGSLYSEHKVENLYLEKTGADNLIGENLSLRRIYKDHKETVACKTVEHATQTM